MNRGTPSNNAARLRSLLTLSLSLLFLLSASATSAAQSGRRIPKQKPSTESSPSKIEDSQARPPAPAEEKEKTKVVVVKHLPHINSSAIYTNQVVEECVARLRQAPTLSVTSGKDMRRKDASEYARQSEDTYVVFIQLEAEVADTEDPRVSIGPIPSRILYVEYILFEPGTGKQTATGHIYQHRNVPLPTKTPTSTGDAEQRMRRAGRETADRVLDALRISLPPGKLNHSI